MAAELYAQDGSPCATCTCSFMSLKPGPGVQLGFAAESGLTLRVCRIGRDPVVAQDGTAELWCDDYSSFTKIVPLPAGDLSRMQEEASRGFLGDLAQGVRPMPRSLDDLRWYDRGLKEGWLPAHRISVEEGDHELIRGPWEQFLVVGATPAFGDGHTPAVAQTVLQAKDRRTYLLLENGDGDEVVGVPQSHGWWVNQVSSGAALPLEHPTEAKRSHRLLVLRGGEHVLSAHTYCYVNQADVQVELQKQADSSQKTAEAALRRGNSLVADLCIRRGLRAVPDHPGLKALMESASEASAP
jgi:hypothetical protein